MSNADRPHAINQQAYDRIASSWDAARITFYGNERAYVETLLADLPPASMVVDLGCGTGRPLADYVLARGHRVVGVDQSVALLALARERHPQAVWIQASLEDFEFDDVPAAVICWDALFHLPRALHGPILARAADALQAGGRLMLTVGGSAHPAFVDTMFGERFFYDSFPPDEAVALVRELGFHTLITEFMNAPTGGRDKGRFAIVAEKQSSRG